MSSKFSTDTLSLHPSKALQMFNKTIKINKIKRKKNCASWILYTKHNEVAYAGG